MVDHWVTPWVESLEILKVHWKESHLDIMMVLKRDHH